MKKNETNAFVSQLLVFTLLMIGISGTFGMSMVWMRTQISHVANSNKQLVTRINEVERRIAEVNTAIESEQDPRVLLRRNAEWHLGLEMPRNTQVTRIDENPMMKLATKRNSRIFVEGDNVVSFTIAPRH